MGQEESYSQQLGSQYESAKNFSALNFYFQDIYEYFRNATADKTRVLEIGSGAGTSILFLQNEAILRTDILPSSNPNVLGGIDAHNLPFKSGTFDTVIGMDVFHHLSSPTKALGELVRVLNDNEGIKILPVEPFVSVLSYLPYKLFHTEETSLFRHKHLKEPLFGDNPACGDQAIPRLYFSSKRGIKHLERLFPSSKFELELFYTSILSFFATGGINKPLPTPTWVVRILVQIEKKVPQRIMRFLASRMAITITQIEVR